MEHEGAVLTDTGGGGFTHLLHLVAAAPSVGSSQLSPACLDWICAEREEQGAAGSGSKE
jgi:hypothetical protein